MRPALILCILYGLLVFAQHATAQTRTSIRDTLYNADGSRTAGQIEITWNGFRSADGKTIAAGKTTRRITDGVLDLALVPNAGATPAGTSYAVTYLLTSGLSYSETWVVPQSDTPVSLAAVRASVAPAPSVQVGQQQLSEGGGLQVLLDFYRAASAAATRAGQCYWNTAANALYCSTGAGTWQNYAPGMPASHAGTHAGNGADPLALDASQIASGTLTDARLPGTISGDKTLNGSLTLGSSNLKFTGAPPGPVWPFIGDLDTLLPLGAIRVNGLALLYATDYLFPDIPALVIPPDVYTVDLGGGTCVLRRDVTEQAAGAESWYFAAGQDGLPSNPVSRITACSLDEQDCFTFFNLARYNTGAYAGYQVVLDPDRAGATAVGGKFKVFGSSTFPGGTEGQLSHTGNLAVSPLTAPPAPQVIPKGQGGSTNWAYKVVAVLGSTSSEASSPTAISNGNATLSSSNYNQITWSAVTGAASYDIYRTTAGGTPSSTGKIANVTALALNDTGRAGDATIAPTTNTTGVVTAVSVIDRNNVLWWGAKCDGVTDDSAAFSAWLTALKGSSAAFPPFASLSRRGYIPSGICIINSPTTFHLVAEHSGLTLYGDGPYASVIKYTYDVAAPTNYLICHDEAPGTGNVCGNPLGDGALQRFTLRDIGFIGPGGTAGHHAGWFWDNGTAATGGLRVDRIMVSGFQDGYRIEGTAGVDTAHFSSVSMRDVLYPIHANNVQAAPNSLDSPDFCTSAAAGASVFQFETNAASAWTVNGGYLCTASATGNILHYLSTYNGGFSNASFTATGTHIELLGGGGSTSQLVYDQSFQAGKDIMFVGATIAAIQGTLPRVIVSIGTKSNFVWKGGFFGGLVNLLSDVAAPERGAPSLSIVDARWEQDGSSYAPPTEYINCTAGPVTQGAPGLNCTTVGVVGSTYRPRIYYRSVNVIGVGFIPDRYTGPPALGTVASGLDIFDPNVLAGESLTDGAFALEPGAGNWGVTGGWDAAFTGKKANYDGTGGGGNLIQTAAKMAIAGVRNRWYKFTYTVTVPLGNIGATITNAFATAAVTLPLTAGAQTVYVKSNAAPGTFTIAATGAGSFSIDDLSLKESFGGDGIFNGFVNWSGQKRVTTQFDKTNDAVLGNIPGLRVNVEAAKTYSFEAVLFTTSNVASGVQAAIAGTATATAIIYEGLTVNAGLTTQGRALALGGAVGAVTAVTAAQIKINGTITVNAAGTLTVQFAQNVAGGVASSVLVGSTFTVENIP
jgi:hypothetical protein